MGLGITVGILVDLLENDLETVEDLRDEFNAINVQLRKAGLPEHHEPEALPPLDARTDIGSFPYSSLHALRRVYAYNLAYPGKPVPPLPEGSRVSQDPLIEHMSSPIHHLLWHSDCEGYYIPIDFPRVIEHESLPGAGVGSSQRLLAELVSLAPVLGIVLDAGILSDAEAERIINISEAEEHPFATEFMVWISLYEAARLSIAHRTAIHFG